MSETDPKLVPLMGIDSSEYKQKAEAKEKEAKSKNKLKAEPSKNDAKGSRYSKTFAVLQQMGLLEYALQTAKLSKENELLQQKINKLESEVNKSSQKVKQGLKEHLGRLQKVSQCQ